MSGNSRIVIIFLGAALLAGLAMAGLAAAQPGGESDPVVSLSYLEAELAYSQIVLEGGEEFSVTGGRGIVLVDGNCRLNIPAGSAWKVVDITSGEVADASLDMQPGHFYLPVPEAGESGTCTLLAWQRSALAIPGSSGSP
jgi:hypothetical protein